MTSRISPTNIEMSTPKNNASNNTSFSCSVFLTFWSWMNAAMVTPKIQPKKPATKDRPQPRCTPRRRLLNQPTTMMNGMP